MSVELLTQADVIVRARTSHPREVRYVPDPGDADATYVVVMFYCGDCQIAEGLPETLGVRSLGVCEVCGKTAVCNDTPSRLLRDPARFRRVEATLRRAGGGEALDLIRADAPPSDVERAVRDFVEGLDE